MSFINITENNKSKKYKVSVDLPALERIAGALGLFKTKFVKDLNESVRDMKAGKVVKARGLDNL